MIGPTLLGVWGDPITHSKSPDLHAAAYRVLGLDWQYGRRQVAEEEFARALEERTAQWRGLSLTMPLKAVAYAASQRRDQYAELTGAVNTLHFGDVVAGFNTDVGGIVDALAESGVHAASTARILGSGATAASALVAAHSIGVQDFSIVARRPERARSLVALAERLDASVRVVDFSAPPVPVEVTFATLPSGTTLDTAYANTLASSGGALFEAAYAPWPSDLASRWAASEVISGLAMLLHQAVRQIRIFVHGDPQSALDKEDAVIGAMRSALMGD